MLNKSSCYKCIVPDECQQQLFSCYQVIYIYTERNLPVYYCSKFESASYHNVKVAHKATYVDLCT